MRPAPRPNAALLTIALPAALLALAPPATA